MITTEELLDKIDTVEDQQSTEGISLKDFRAYMPTHNYIYMPTRDMWPATSVNARVPAVPILDDDGEPKLNKKEEPETIPASVWLDQNAPVEQMTWAPGKPLLIPDRIVSEGGWIDYKGVTCFNLYRPPTITLGNASEAAPWVEHVHKVYPDGADHIIMWFAQRRQQPEIKINHALILGGAQGIGKDTLLEPVKRAVGAWNMSEVSPQAVTRRFNGFLKSIILRVNESKDLGDISRYDFYDAMKAYTASPPDVLRVDEKNLREHHILNCCGVIYTTNHKQNGMFLPADDRRHYVAWSNLTKDDFTSAYWDKLWSWYNNDGDRHVAAYLATLDIAKFNPKAPPPKTVAFWDIVEANRAPEESDLADVIDALGNPAVVTIQQITEKASPEFSLWMRDRRNRRVIPFHLEKCGYVLIRNDADKHDGQWKIDGKRQCVYAKTELPVNRRYRAVAKLQESYRDDNKKATRMRVFSS